MRLAAPAHQHLALAAGEREGLDGRVVPARAGEGGEQNGPAAGKKLRVSVRDLTRLELGEVHGLPAGGRHALGADRACPKTMVSSGPQDAPLVGGPFASSTLGPPSIATFRSVRGGSSRGQH